MSDQSPRFSLGGLLLVMGLFSLSFALLRFTYAHLVTPFPEQSQYETWVRFASSSSGVFSFLAAISISIRQLLHSRWVNAAWGVLLLLLIIVLVVLLVPAIG